MKVFPFLLFQYIHTVRRGHIYLTILVSGLQGILIKVSKVFIHLATLSLFKLYNCYVLFQMPL